MILDEIVRHKARYLADQMQRIPADIMQKRAERGERVLLDFTGALRCDKLSIIAEVKKASPSKGVIRADFAHMAIARDYLASDVQAISVLTETAFFQGSPDYLSDIRAISDIPLLRKDFIIDVYQIYEAYVLGADAILLIAALLTDQQLREFGRIAHGLGLQCLVEVHGEPDLLRVLDVGFKVIGINNRNLHTFEENLTVTARLAEKIPSDRVIVGESGIRQPSDLHYMHKCGVDAVLIGEAFMRCDDIPAAVERLRGGM